MLYSASPEVTLNKDVQQQEPFKGRQGQIQNYKFVGISGGCRMLVTFPELSFMYTQQKHT